MPYNRNDTGLTKNEFLKQVCRWADSSSTQTAAKWLDAIYEVIVRELYYNGSCRVPELGTFGLEHLDEYYQTQEDKSGKKNIYRVPERDIPTFVPNDEFINDVNMQGVTKKFRKRMKAGKVTRQDYLRQLRAESVDAFGSLQEQRVEQAKENFQKLLKEKRKNTKGKVEPEVDEED